MGFLIITLLIMASIYYLCKKVFKYKILILAIPAALSVATIYSKNLSTILIEKTYKLGLSYYDWDWHHNAVENGLLIHLLYTSNRPSPVKMTDEQKEEFNNLINNTQIKSQSTKLFISILCEACWYDDKLFKDTFQPLMEMGGLEVRGISPIIGGGTPNSSIEMLTGLPIVNPALSGVVYQEYRDFIRDKTSTLPSHLQDNGFRTFSAHNFARRFWFRSTVEPRLGFQDFYGIEDMNPKEKSDDYYPRDTILFNFALQEISKESNKPLFVNLATVYTHSPFIERDGDGGSAHYKEKITTSIADMATFISAVKEINPDAVFLIYGDHKPRLQVLDDYKYADKHKRGDMPVILIDPDSDRAKRFTSKVNGKPFYCYATATAKTYYEMELPISKYTDNICQSYSQEHYDYLSKSLPAWIYSAVLFN